MNATSLISKKLYCLVGLSIDERMSRVEQELITAQKRR